MREKKENPRLQPGASESPSEGTVHCKDSITPSQVKLSDLLVDMGQGSEALRCPYCKDYYSMHHTVAEVFSRVCGGADSGAHVTMEISDPFYTPSAPAITIDGDMSRNPSASRGGVVIRFYCEHGCPPLMLCIGQCKGMELFAVGGAL